MAVNAFAMRAPANPLETPPPSPALPMSKPSRVNAFAGSAMQAQDPNPPAPMAAPAAAPQPNTFVQPKAERPGVMANAFKAFATGFVGPDAIQKIDDRYKTEAQEKAKRALLWMQQTAAQPAERRAAFTLASAQDIARDTGQPYEAILASAQDPNTFSDEALSGAIARFSALAGVTPEETKYQSVNLGNGGFGVMDTKTGKVRIDREPTPAAPKPEAQPRYATTIVNGRVVAYNVEDPTQKHDMGAAPASRTGGAAPRLTPYQEAQIERQRAADAAKRKATDTQRDINTTSLKDGMSRIDQFLLSKGFEGLYGSFWGFSKPENLMSQEEINSLAMLNQIGGEAFLAGVAKMRGTGPLSDNEGKRVMAAVQRLTDRRQDAASARAAAAEFKAAMQGLLDAYAREAAAADPGPAGGADPSAQFDGLHDEIDAALAGEDGGGLTADEQAELEALRAELGGKR